MKGLVLCGGQSSRMGQDKGLLTMQALTWAERACRQLAAIAGTVAISVNHTQITAYREALPHELLADNDSLTVQGPLKGLFTAHLQWPEEDWLILACDMIYMEAPPLQQLVSYFDQQQPEAVIYTSAQGLEPLCGIYSAAALKRLLTFYLQGKGRKYSMQYALTQLTFVALPLPAAWQPYFANMNTPEQLM